MTRNGYRSRRAVDRVKRALARLSRDRWLSGKEVINLSFRLAACCSDRPSRTAERAVPAASTVIGMIRGMPPALHFEPDFIEFFCALSNVDRDAKAKAELIIINLLLKRLSHAEH